MRLRHSAAGESAAGRRVSLGRGLFIAPAGFPAVVAQLLTQGLLFDKVLTANGRTLGENCRAALILDEAVIRPFGRPLAQKAGFLVLHGNLFDSAVMKTSVISTEFRDRYLSDPKDPDAFEGSAVVFDGPEDYHARIDDPALNIDAQCVLFMRGAGAVGYPGGAEVVNMRAPVRLIEQNIHVLPCIGDGRQSGTSGSPSILNASPEAAVGGNLAILMTGDRDSSGSFASVRGERDAARIGNSKTPRSA